jgi:hypothetical protein
MFCRIKDNFLYILCPKNGYITHNTFLEAHGWDYVNLFDPKLDHSQYNIFAHITDPEVRHTKGITQYLRLNPDLSLDDAKVAKLLVSGVFDEHTYSLSMMLGPLWNLPIHWIPLDVSIKDHQPFVPFNPEEHVYTGNDLTNQYFAEHGLDLVIERDRRMNVATAEERDLRRQIEYYKTVYEDNYHSLQKNFLEHDINKYRQVVEDYRQKFYHLPT